MAKSKNNRAATRRLNRECGPSDLHHERSGPISTSFGKLDIHREIRYITERAQAEDSRIVTAGAFVLFSTQTRDAWLLDREDDLIKGYPTVEIAAACGG